MFKWAFNVFWYDEDNLFSGKRFTLIHNAMTVQESIVLVNYISEAVDNPNLQAIVHILKYCSRYIGIYR